MPKALSFDLRSRVLAAIDAGLSCRQAATRFGVSASSAIRWQGMRREGGDARPKPQGGDRLSHRTAAHADRIHAALAEVPDITLPEVKARLAAQGAQVSVSALWRFCRRHRITRKKLRRSGLVAPFVLDGPINRAAFEAYVEKVLVPELRPGDVVILDNLSSHKGARVRALIEAVGASLLYLPPYSPDFNPIENAFAKLKALLRKAAERTVEGLWTAIGSLLDAFTPVECTNYFQAAGYDAT